MTPEPAKAGAQPISTWEKPCNKPAFGTLKAQPLRTFGTRDSGRFGNDLRLER